MRKITKIEYQKNKNNRVNIYLDNSYEFGLNIDTMIKYSLSKDMELDEAFIREILIEEEKLKAFNYALTILSRSSKSEKQIFLKLKNKGYDDELISQTLEKLKSLKYVDDEDFSGRYIHDKINFSRYGKQRIKEALYTKGIDRKTIEDKLKEISDVDEYKRAYSLAKKKINSLSKYEPVKKKVKLSYFLINKGFEYDIVKKVLYKLFSDIEE